MWIERLVSEVNKLTTKSGEESFPPVMKTIGLFKASYVTFAEKKIYKDVFKGLCWRRGYTSSALPTKDHNLHQWRERFPDVKPQTKTENSGGARDADLPSANLYIAFSFSDSTLSVEQS